LKRNFGFGFSGITMFGLISSASASASGKKKYPRLAADPTSTEVDDLSIGMAHMAIGNHRHVQETEVYELAAMLQGVALAGDGATTTATTTTTNKKRQTTNRPRVPNNITPPSCKDDSRLLGRYNYEMIDPKTNQVVTVRRCSRHLCSK
jgi:hypothetical protein